MRARNAEAMLLGTLLVGGGAVLKHKTIARKLKNAHDKFKSLKK